MLLEIRAIITGDHNMRKSKLGFSVCVSVVLLLVFGLSVSLSASEAEDIGDVKWSFVVYSDNRGSNPTHRAVLTSIAKVKPEIILNLGDVVFRSADYGTMDSFKKDVEECYGSFDDFVKIFYPSIGGHEERYYNQEEYPPDGMEPDNKAGCKFYDEVGLKERVEEFNDEYGDYYFSHKNIHFIMLYRSDEWEFRDGQVTWLKGILEKIDGKDPIIITGHAGGWFYPLSATQRQILKLIQKYNVDIALGADWHDYYAFAHGNLMMFRSGSAGWGDGIFIRFDLTDKGFIIRTFEPDGVTLFTKRKDTDGSVISPYWIKPFGKPGQEMEFE